MTSALSPEDLRLLEDLFDRAADLPHDERAAFVVRECGSNVALRDELSLLIKGLTAEDVVTQIRLTAPPGTGARIGRYVLRERVGEGGMGEVFAADQQEPVSRRVALKLIKPGMDSKQVVARFEAERQALARMTHPNVAHVLDGGTTDDGRPYFVMEFVAGDPITEACDRLQLSTRERLELFLSVCDGVQHAHQKGLIHRDLKPSNLLVTEQDDRAVPKIIDFGVARATTGQLSERSLHTVVGQVVGTLDYMSPEQADPGGVDIDTRSDVYSLGVVLYQLLSGLLPFDHQSAAGTPFSEIQRMIRDTDPPTPSTRLRRATDTATTIAPRHGTDKRALVRQLSGDLDWICMKALEKDPARRYASASELAADVRRHLAHEPVLAGRPGAVYRARKFVRRHRVGVAAGAVVVAALVAGVYGIVAGRIEADANAARADANAKRADDNAARAEANAARAEAERAQAQRLADGYRLQRIETVADELWPPHPERIDALEDLRSRTSLLVEKLATHVATLEDMRRKATRVASGELPADRTWSFDSSEDQWQHDALSALVAGLQRLRSNLLEEGELTRDAYGWSVEARLEYARLLRAHFAEGGADRRMWSAVLPEILAAYPELDTLTPQMGLVPLGPDPDTGLWEFAHLMSGPPAQRDPETGRIRPEGDMGLVLVLLPGGTFSMGAQRTDPRGANFDPASNDKEGPVHDVTLEPFFLSKFEMTWGQWNRFVVADAATIPSAVLRPVNDVNWVECERTTRRLGLVLPTEKQWEYAARAGTTTPWWTGAEAESLQGAANLLDPTLIEILPFAADMGYVPVAWSDGFGALAPAGSLRPNPFGLHEMLGNVTEWCRGHPYRYDLGPDVVLRAGVLGKRQGRGGNNRTGSDEARVSFREFNADAELSEQFLGLRPARALDP